MLYAIVVLLTVIACAAIVATAYLLDQRRTLRDRITELEWREACLARHSLTVIAERNQCRNALLHASEELSRERLLRACSGKGFFRETWGSG